MEWLNDKADTHNSGNNNNDEDDDHSIVIALKKCFRYILVKKFQGDQYSQKNSVFRVMTPYSPLKIIRTSSGRYHHHHHHRHHLYFH
jgi:hypothetical protein